MLWPSNALVMYTAVFTTHSYILNLFQIAMSAPAVKPVLPAPSAGGQPPTSNAASPLKNHTGAPNNVAISLVQDKTPEKPKDPGKIHFLPFILFSVCYIFLSGLQLTWFIVYQLLILPIMLSRNPHLMVWKLPNQHHLQ